MAVVRKMERVVPGKIVPHTETKCTYSVVIDDHGEKYLQIDTFGSEARKHPGKQSQTIRFAPEAVAQLRQILAKEL